MLKINRDSLEKAVSIITTLIKSSSNAPDLIRFIPVTGFLTFQVNSLSMSVCIPLETDPPIIDNDNKLIISLADLKMVLSILNVNNKFISFSRQGDKLIVEDQSNGKVLVTPTGWSDREIIDGEVIPHLKMPLSTLTEICKAALIHLPVENTKNNYVFFSEIDFAIIASIITNQSIVLSEITSVQQSDTFSTLALPYRLIAALSKHKLPLTLNIFINRIKINNDLYLQIKFSDNYWIIIQDYVTEFTKLNALDYDLPYKLQLSKTRAVQEFTQIAKFTEKDDTPTVILNILPKELEAAAYSLALTDATLEKKIPIHSNLLEDINRVLVNPQLILNAIESIDQEMIDIHLSNNKREPLLITSELSPNIKVYVSKHIN